MFEVHRIRLKNQSLPISIIHNPACNYWRSSLLLLSPSHLATSYDSSNSTFTIDHVTFLCAVMPFPTSDIFPTQAIFS